MNIFTKKAFLFLIILCLAGIQSCSSRQQLKVNPGITESAEIMSALKAGKNVLVEDKTVHGDLDFTELENKSKEGKGLYRLYITSSVTFINCVFTGKITAYKNRNEEIILCDFAKNLSFHECQFKEEVNFRESIVHGNASFNGSFFIGRTTFEGIRFMGEAGFNRANFAEELRLQHAGFGNKCNFMDAVFGKTAYFQGSIFYADAQFSSSWWNGYADFSICHFRAGVFFNYAVFGERAVFNNSVFSARAEFHKTTFTGKGELMNCQYAGPVKMQEANVQTEINLSGSVYFFGLPDTANFVKSAHTVIIADKVKEVFPK